MTLEQSIKLFLDHQLANGRSPHTIGAQQRDLNLLLDRLGSDCDIQVITSSDIDAFLLSESVQKQSNDQPKQTSSRQIQRRLDHWIARAGIDKRITPHSLRHSFATGLYARTSNILVVQQALGHASIATTMIYSHLLDESFEEALETL